ncbi:MAG TPA: CDP-diacylglycerol--glycerol-3-phosphate 3-phosphatidyltransferase [Rhodospirillaceae bacterium]|nr:CDP-diacylglycerol--glycerol-3-phosphate 3-phosphatidyltransferase [Rhodospirillaceae bacterium]HAT34466.1 CDP-diacylglycerol--glycerol-3-phosphate 3-phosphatidyltransferase [Rhodospirillaceae bacterium]
MLTNLANLLTVSRILVIVPLIALLYAEGHTVRWVALALFTAACLTDFFDGYIARSMNQISNFGRFLDPVADKLLVAAVAFMLVADGRINGLVVLPALVIMMREILVSGLREYLADLKVRLPVSSLAKWKTLIQMIALGHLIIHDAGPVAYPTIMIGEVGIWAAAVLTLITGYDYLSASRRHLTDDMPSENGKDG